MNWTNVHYIFSLETYHPEKNFKPLWDENKDNLESR